MTRSFSFVLQYTEYGECVRALLIGKDRSEIWMEWGMMEPNSFLSQTVTAISTPYCLRWHKSKPKVRLGGGLAVVWGDMRLMFYAFRSTLLIVLARWDYFRRYNIDIALSSYMELRPLNFMACLCSKSSLFLIYTSGAFNDTEFCLCVVCFLFSVNSYWEMVKLSRLNSFSSCSKIHFLHLAKSTAFWIP